MVRRRGLLLRLAGGERSTYMGSALVGLEVLSSPSMRKAAGTAPRTSTSGVTFSFRNRKRWLPDSATALARRRLCRCAHPDAAGDAAWPLHWRPADVGSQGHAAQLQSRQQAQAVSERNDVRPRTVVFRL